MHSVLPSLAVLLESDICVGGLRSGFWLKHPTLSSTSGAAHRGGVRELRSIAATGTRVVSDRYSAVVGHGSDCTEFDQVGIELKRSNCVAWLSVFSSPHGLESSAVGASPWTQRPEFGRSRVIDCSDGHTRDLRRAARWPSRSYGAVGARASLRIPHRNQCRYEWRCVLLIMAGPHKSHDEYPYADDRRNDPDDHDGTRRWMWTPVAQ